MAEGFNQLTAPENMKEEILLPSYTCGVCETICTKDEIYSHSSCLEGYDKFCVDDNLYFYPQIDGEEVILTDTIQVSNQEAKSNWRNSKILEEEQLIEEIHKRPPLWNFKLPLSERTMQAKKKLWEEIKIAINNTMDIATMKKKWKSLCDTYRTYENKQQKSSGSAGFSQKKWMHFERMKFLNDMQPEIETVTNIATFLSEESNDTITFDERSSSGHGSYKPINIPSFVPLTPPPSNKAALYGNLVAAQLRDINPQVMDNTMLQIAMLNNVKKKNPY
ncbi:uncharacterized protein [Anoplolepis gracilipes]|uniref:uncharacterized protein n=1 Tax=Anoplolepis gracilipes TaxID=354296 RepID=UPI003B9E26D9